jgi:signal transduction histidine kinase
MSGDSQRRYSETVVVLAPTGRDAEVTRSIFSTASIECIIAASASAAAELIRNGIGALVLTDRVLVGRPPVEIFDALAQQPSWSDLAVLALCRDVEHAPAVLRVLERLTNVAVLDRPTSRSALISSVKAALRGRRWQYRIRDQIKELMLAEEALRQADRRKDEFLATLAHELRNPLAPIKTGVQLMSSVDPASKQFLHLRDVMDRQLTLLVKLIDDLLDVSRIVTGRVVLQRERLDLRNVVRTAVESCLPFVETAKHSLSVSLPDAAVWVRGDTGRLAQALSNLVNNAAKYTRSGGSIQVELQSTGDEAVLTVADNGLGIPSEMLDRVFEMFTQVNRTLDRSQGGLGIGLALVRNLIELHGGTVTAFSDGDNSGSAFTIRLPVASSEGMDERPSAGDGVDPALIRRMRILVVDDNVDAADTLAMMLNERGHLTRVVYNGADALKTATDFRPEAIFCDIGMTGIGGMEVAARLRRDARFATTVLVAITGWGTDEDIRLTQQSGFDFHLTKPASSESVQRILSRL